MLRQNMNWYFPQFARPLMTRLISLLRNYQTVKSGIRTVKLLNRFCSHWQDDLLERICCYTDHYFFHHTRGFSTVLYDELKNVLIFSLFLQCIVPFI